TMVEMTSAEMTDEEDVSLEIRVLGNFAVIRNRGNVCLPPSRKTRALLAYLAVTNRPQHRERLCTMFWEVPDDPRGALRWSLWKIRQIVNINGGGALVTDGNMVVLRSQSIALDLRRIKAISMGDLASQDISELENVARLFRGGFLEDLSLPRCPQFQAWRIAWIDEVNLFKARLLRTLIDRLRGDASRAFALCACLTRAASPGPRNCRCQGGLGGAGPRASNQGIDTGAARRTPRCAIRGTVSGGAEA